MTTGATEGNEGITAAGPAPLPVLTGKPDESQSDDLGQWSSRFAFGGVGFLMAFVFLFWFTGVSVGPAGSTQAGEAAIVLILVMVLNLELIAFVLGLFGRRQHGGRMGIAISALFLFAYLSVGALKLVVP